MKNVEMIRERLRARSPYNAVQRIFNIFGHYGPTVSPFRALLQDFVNLCLSHHVLPTFPVTATAVNRHPGFFRHFQTQGIEFAIHGCRHIDHTLLSTDEFHEQMQRAIRIFRHNGIRFSGFRFPFLRRNLSLSRIVSGYGFEWESSEVISWPLPGCVTGCMENPRDYQKIIDTYGVASHEAGPALPFVHQGNLEIPVTVPDDDILIERLNLSRHCVRESWLEILGHTRLRGDMFVMQLHPERFPFFRSALNDVLNEARMSGSVWIAPLGEIAAWWKSRLNAACSVSCSGDASWKVMCKNTACDQVPLQLCCAGKILDESGRENRDLKVKAPVKPVIGLNPPVAQEFIDFLRQEGYLFEEAEKKQSYALVFDGGSFSDKNKAELIRAIEGSDKPLLRFARWPSPYRSVLSVTGDIDGLDFWDYWTRFYGK
ncbi:polysaccharide deacetylase family protein [bacterium]|nr:polysaccharide deacetylase family protein [bacterium]